MLENWSHSNLRKRISGFARRYAGEGVIRIVGGARTGATEEARVARAAEVKVDAVETVEPQPDDGRYAAPVARNFGRVVVRMVPTQHCPFG